MLLLRDILISVTKLGEKRGVGGGGDNDSHFRSEFISSVCQREMSPKELKIWY